MGEAAYWGEDIDGQPLNRLWGEVGVRATLPMWSVDPNVVQRVLQRPRAGAQGRCGPRNSRPPIPTAILTSLPLYDLIDDDPVDAFRRMFLTTTFGLPNNSLVPTGLPYLPKFDERFYALRTGLQDWVTSPSTEIAGDLMALRLGADQRWQTKRARRQPAHHRLDHARYQHYDLPRRQPR